MHSNRLWRIADAIVTQRSPPLHPARTRPAPAAATSVTAAPPAAPTVYELPAAGEDWALPVPSMTDEQRFFFDRAGPPSARIFN
jgi:hypothetical protein